MKMFRMEARSMVDKIDKSGPPSAKYFPSGAIKALNVKQVKMTQVYIKADTTMDGSRSQTISIKGPVDNPVHKASPFKYMKRIPSSFPEVFLEKASNINKIRDPIPLNKPPSQIPLQWA